MPPITLIFWGTGLLRGLPKDNYSREGGITVLLIGLAILFFFFEFLELSGICLRFQDYQFSV